MYPRVETLLTSSWYEEKFEIKFMYFLQAFLCNVSHADIFHSCSVMPNTRKLIICNHIVLDPSMLGTKYHEPGCTWLATRWEELTSNTSECNVSHGGIALHLGYRNPCHVYEMEGIELKQVMDKDLGMIMDQ